jgi:hypothetical protein
MDHSSFSIDSEITRQYRRFNAIGTQLTVGLLHPPDTDDVENTDPMSHFVASMNDPIDYALSDFADSDMVGLTITNEENVQDKAIGLSFRQKDQLTADVIWSVFQKVTQSNCSRSCNFLGEGPLQTKRLVRRNA